MVVDVVRSPGGGVGGEGIVGGRIALKPGGGSSGGGLGRGMVGGLGGGRPGGASQAMPSSAVSALSSLWFESNVDGLCVFEP